MKLIWSLIFLVLIVGVCFYWYGHSRGRVLKGDNWTAKQYGVNYIVSVHNGAELAAALNDFVQKSKITLGSIDRTISNSKRIQHTAFTLTLAYLINSVA